MWGKVGQFRSLVDKATAQKLSGESRQIGEHDTVKVTHKKMNKIAFVGAGKVAEAMISGMLSKGFRKNQPHPNGLRK